MLGHITETPHPPDDSSTNALGKGKSLKDPAITELKNIKGILVRVIPEPVYPFDERIPIFKLVFEVGQDHLLILLLDYRFRDVPHVEELLVVIDDLSCPVDHKDSI